LQSSIHERENKSLTTVSCPFGLTLEVLIFKPHPSQEGWGFSVYGAVAPAPT